MEPTESAVLVLVPEAEDVIASHRAELDAAAVLGVPAHVTVLYPFVPPERHRRAGDREACRGHRSVAAFEVTFARTRWFERSVLWLAPEPDEPFRALTAAAQRAFPGYLPYGGAHPDVVAAPDRRPGSARGPAGIGGAGDRAAACPSPPPCRSAVLMQGSLQPGTWRRRRPAARTREC